MENLRWADRSHGYLACEIEGETLTFPTGQGNLYWETAKGFDLSALPETSELELLRLDLLAALKAQTAERLRTVSHPFGDTPPEFNFVYLLKYELLLSIGDPRTPEARELLEADAKASGQSFEDFCLTVARKRQEMIARVMAISTAYDAGKRAIQLATSADEDGMRRAFDTAMVAVTNAGG